MSDFSSAATMSRSRASTFSGRQAMQAAMAASSASNNASLLGAAAQQADRSTGTVGSNSYSESAIDQSMLYKTNQDNMAGLSLQLLLQAMDGWTLRHLNLPAGVSTPFQISIANQFATLARGAAQQSHLDPSAAGFAAVFKLISDANMKAHEHTTAEMTEIRQILLAHLARCIESPDQGLNAAVMVQMVDSTVRQHQASLAAWQQVASAMVQHGFPTAATAFSALSSTPRPAQRVETAPRIEPARVVLQPKVVAVAVPEMVPEHVPIPPAPAPIIAPLAPAVAIPSHIEKGVPLFGIVPSAGPPAPPALVSPKPAINNAKPKFVAPVALNAPMVGGLEVPHMNAAATSPSQLMRQAQDVHTVAPIVVTQKPSFVAEVMPAQVTATPVPFVATQKPSFVMQAAETPVHVEVAPSPIHIPRPSSPPSATSSFQFSPPALPKLFAAPSVSYVAPQPVPEVEAGRSRSSSQPMDPQRAAMIAQQAMISHKRMSSASDDSSRMAAAAAVAAIAMKVPEAIRESNSSSLQPSASATMDDLPQAQHSIVTHDAYAFPQEQDVPARGVYIDSMDDEGYAVPVSSDTNGAAVHRQSVHHAKGKLTKKKTADSGDSGVKTCSECSCTRENTGVFSSKCKNCGHKH